MFRCKNKMWLENPPELFCSLSVIPLRGMSSEAQANSITRLVIVIFLILLLLGFKYSGLFILISLILIIILYYLQRNIMERFNTENYKAPHAASYIQNNRNRGVKINSDRRVSVDRPSTYRFCDDDVLLQYNDPNYVSANQRLAGKANPKTLIAPVITPPSHDLTYWKANNLVTHSAINGETQQDAYQSGFMVSTCCPNSLNNDYMVPEARCKPKSSCDQYKTRASRVNRYKKVASSVQEDYAQDRAKYEPKGGRGGEVKEGFENPYAFEYPYVLGPKEPGDMNIACGYNPNQLCTAGLPTNLAVGNCEQDPAMKQYNENLFTQTIQPGVYSRSEINEPINYNIGISFDQQFLPTTCEENSRGEVMYVQHDPRLFQEDPIEPYVEGVNMANVFDPRFSGYGTSYRSYTDDMLGQTRFMYDDVNAIRMPNLITRSKVDFLPFADTYGPIPQGNSAGNKYHSDIRGMVNDAFLRDSLTHRNSIMASQSRKVRSEAWQQRKAPIRTGGQFMSGGLSSCRR